MCFKKLIVIFDFIAKCSDFKDNLFLMVCLFLFPLSGFPCCSLSGISTSLVNRFFKRVVDCPVLPNSCQFLGRFLKQHLNDRCDHLILRQDARDGLFQ